MPFTIFESSPGVQKFFHPAIPDGMDMENKENTGKMENINQMTHTLFMILNTQFMIQNTLFVTRTLHFTASMATVYYDILNRRT